MKAYTQEKILLVNQMQIVLDLFQNVVPTNALILRIVNIVKVGTSDYR
jgi:hypothetical protein